MSRRPRRGFALLEALLALVLAALLFGGIALYTGTWLRSWGGIIERGTREDTIAVVLDRIVEDIEAARPVYDESARGGAVAFEGTGQEVRFVRQALGFGARAGLDRISYLNGSAGGQPAIIRARRAYPASFASGGEDLPLIRDDPRLSFAYAAADGAFVDTWRNETLLPAIVRITISGSAPRPWSQTGYALVRSEFPAVCGTPQEFQDCRARRAPQH